MIFDALFLFKHCWRALSSLDKIILPSATSPKRGRKGTFSVHKTALFTPPDGGGRREGIHLSGATSASHVFPSAGPAAASAEEEEEEEAPRSLARIAGANDKSVYKFHYCQKAISLSTNRSPPGGKKLAFSLLAAGNRARVEEEEVEEVEEGQNTGNDFGIKCLLRGLCPPKWAWPSSPPPPPPSSSKANGFNFI